MILQALHKQGYTTDGASFSTGRPDRATLALVTRQGEPVVGKVYPSGGGERTYRNMQELWRSSFGAWRTPPGLPRPIDYLPDVGVVIMERLDGRPLAELGRVDQETLDGAIRLLASLHDSDAQPDHQRDSRRILGSIRRKARQIAELAPESAAPIWSVVRALEATWVEDRELVPCHGDFSPRNILVGPGRLALIDWDRFQRTDPARDVAYIGAWSWVAALRENRPADWSALEHAVAVYRSLRPQAGVETRLGFYAAAGLVRIAHSLVKLWPEDAHLAPRLAAEALRACSEVRSATPSRLFNRQRVPAYAVSG
jgi:aminoglycoside phosphotransferase (APT) family kinase protein